METSLGNWTVEYGMRTSLDVGSGEEYSTLVLGMR